MQSDSNSSKVQDHQKDVNFQKEGGEDAYEVVENTDEDPFGSEAELDLLDDIRYPQVEVEIIADKGQDSYPEKTPEEIQDEELLEATQEEL